MRRVTLPDQPQIAAPDFAQDKLTHSIELDLRAVTPIYLGSARPDGIDENYPFRGPSLKGQLRAWWRAMYPGTDVQQLHRDEARLFGGIFGERPVASRVSIGLSQMTSEPATAAELKGHRAVGADLSYALWVDQARSEQRYHVDARARLRVSLGKPESDAETQRLNNLVRLLVLMGASGSRGRRGLGRLWSDELLGSTVTGPEALTALLKDMAPPPATRAWPSLAGASVAWCTGSAFRTAAKAADHALGVFKELRGMKSLGGPHFDGSDRMKLAQRDWLRVKDNEAPTKAFTAALGMPLPYRSSNNHLNGTTTIQPQRGDRLPSPIHVRPIPTTDGWASVFIALQPWYTGPIVSKNRNTPTRNGTLDPDAINKLLAELGRKGWSTHSVGADK